MQGDLRRFFARPQARNLHAAHFHRRTVENVASHARSRPRAFLTPDLFLGPGSSSEMDCFPRFARNDDVIEKPSLRAAAKQSRPARQA